MKASHYWPIVRKIQDNWPIVGIIHGVRHKTCSCDHKLPPSSWVALLKEVALDRVLQGIVSIQKNILLRQGKFNFYIYPSICFWPLHKTLVHSASFMAAPYNTTIIPGNNNWSPLSTREWKQINAAPNTNECPRQNMFRSAWTKV